MKLVNNQKKLNNFDSSDEKSRTAVLDEIQPVPDKYCWLRDRLEFSSFEQSIWLDKIIFLLEKLDRKDIETTAHARRVAAFSVRLGVEIGITQSDLSALWLGSLLHDIGKITVPDRILKKAGKLDQNEWAIMRRHSENGKRLLMKLGFPEPIWTIAESHHEKFDGTGYPKGLKGLQIPLFARIFSAVDTFDAITNNRCYRQKQSFEFAYEEISKNVGTQLDPKIADCFITIHPREWNECQINRNICLRERLAAA